VHNFRLFFIGQIISQVGTWTQQIAVVLLVLDLTDSRIAAGAATAALSLPTLMFGAWDGLTTVVGVALLLLAATTSVWATALIVMPLGAAHIAVVSGSNTLVQLGAEPHMRGRALALMSLVFMGSRPFGALLTGPISEIYSARLAALLGGVICLTTGGLILRTALSPAGTHRERAVLPATGAILAELPDQLGIGAEDSMMVDTATWKCRTYE
jgi:hypothetical protein